MTKKKAFKEPKENTQLMFAIDPLWSDKLYLDSELADCTVCPECLRKLRTLGNFQDVHISHDGVIVRYVVLLQCEGDEHHKVFLGSEIPY